MSTARADDFDPSTGVPVDAELSVTIAVRPFSHRSGGCFARPTYWWRMLGRDRDGSRSRVIDEFQILGLARDGWITGPNGQPYGSIGIVVNCPIIERFL